MRQAFYTSKFYISKKSEKEVCFKLNFEIEISGGGEKIYVSTTDGKTIIEPENLIYKRDEKTFFKLESYVNFGGFVKRLNNFYNDLEKFTQLNKNKIENLEKEIVELKSITGDNTPKYKRKDYLEALREDNRIIMDEIEKMSKQKNYKSDFVPKSAKILEDLNKHNKILKDRELLI
ncbi:hypothetical protein D6195_08540 [Campylobacter coli]|nr:hypothetical protein [Campylobacter coli]